jgi:hypothetical protein
MITEKKIQKVAETMTPEAAAEFLERAEFYIYGGSRHGHAGRRGKRHDRRLRNSLDQPLSPRRQDGVLRLG